jgi:hypothetical protein
MNKFLNFNDRLWQMVKIARLENMKIALGQKGKEQTPV